MKNFNEYVKAEKDKEMALEKDTDLESRGEAWEIPELSVNIISSADWPYNKEQGEIP